MPTNTTHREVQISFTQGSKPLENAYNIWVNGEFRIRLTEDELRQLLGEAIDRLREHNGKEPW